jgi:hypothetical protein
MSETTDPTFYRTPSDAIAAPPERLAYIAAFDPTGRANDAMTVLDCDPDSSDYGRVVGWTELPTAGNELHHFGWNACSSALCHQGHGDHGAPLERRYLIVPGIGSSRTYVLDTKPDPRNPKVVREIQAEELASKAGYSRPHTVHCGPGGIFLFSLGGADGNDGPGGVALIDHDTFDVIGAWEHDRGDQYFAYDGWWHLNYDTMITSEWATPSMVENGLNPEDLRASSPMARRSGGCGCTRPACRPATPPATPTATRPDHGNRGAPRRRAGTGPAAAHSGQRRALPGGGNRPGAGGRRPRPADQGTPRLGARRSWRAPRPTGNTLKWGAVTARSGRRRRWPGSLPARCRCQPRRPPSRAWRWRS